MPYVLKFPLSSFLHHGTSMGHIGRNTSKTQMASSMSPQCTPLKYVYDQCFKTGDQRAFLCCIFIFGRIGRIEVANHTQKLDWGTLGKTLFYHMYIVVSLPINQH